ncbi:Oidioi.mRNA.OKI2018_I69.chr1.g392.t1.cds [Oikopleura dioica]|uniref:Integrin beta n=1 Tax=Oikopleura dioica TaxID=34765 RepID=A0ABN7SLD1_OIKDI|nr:Oidioi.mRNA.OKI2018_I69.chr1.g392.t1.cds [Oikopleura dioica]
MGNLLKFIAFFLAFIGQVANITVEAGKKYKKAKKAAPEPEPELEQEYENENEMEKEGPQNDLMLFALMVGGVWLALIGIRRVSRAFCGSVNIETFGIFLAVAMSYYCYSGNPELFSTMNGNFTKLLASKSAPDFGAAAMEVFRNLAQILLVVFKDGFTCISGLFNSAQNSFNPVKNACVTEYGKMRHLLILLFAAVCETKKRKQEEEFFQCRAKENCGECIQASPKCAWCEDLSIPTTDRCFDASFISNYLNCSSLINPQSRIESSRNRRSADSESDKHGKHKKHKKKSPKKKKNKGKSNAAKAGSLAGKAAAGATGAAGATVLRKPIVSDRDSAQNPFSPSAMNLQIRPFDEFEFEWTFEMPEYQPLDLYFLFDLSYSMEPDVKNLIAYSEKLFEKFENIYPEGKRDYFHVGFGSFVDKRLMPASSENDVILENPCALDPLDSPSGGKCATNFVFENNLPLAQRDGAEFSKDIKRNVKVSSNIDFEEAGLDALIQAAVCDQVGWRNTAQKMIVYISDAGFHTAGEGILSGLLDRYEEKCQLESNVVRDGDKYDYPSVGQAAKILNDRNIMLALTISVDEEDDSDISHVESSYNDLASLIGNSLVEKMSSRQNVDELADQIYKAYKELSERAYVDLSELPTPGYPFNWRITKTEHFDKNGRPVRRDDECTTECEHVLPGHSVRYTTLVEHVPGLATGYAVNAPEIRIGVVEERLQVDMSLIEHCNCENNDVNSDQCESKDLECGICNCGEGYTDDECRVDGDKPPCQNVGHCVCGVCHCPDKFTGDYCQCNLQSFCNAGDCVHGECRETADSTIESCKMECVCEDGWLKDSVGACRCPPNPESCLSVDGQSCGGEFQGSCDCNTCRCNKIADSNNNVLGKWMDDKKCIPFKDECQDYLKKYITCRLDFCESKSDAEGCWEESANECHLEKNPSYKNINFEGNTVQNYGKIDIQNIQPQTYEKAPGCTIPITKIAEWGSEITCSANFGIDIREDNTLSLKVHLFSNDKKSFEENLTKCSMDPKKWMTIAGCSTAALLILLIAIIAILAKWYLNYQSKKEWIQHESNVEKSMHNMTQNALYTNPTSTHNATGDQNSLETDNLLDKTTGSHVLPETGANNNNETQLDETVQAGAAGEYWGRNRQK